MSYIDTFDHELVGFFGGLPLYHPLEVVSGTSVPEPLFFNVTAPPQGYLRNGQANGGEARSAHREKYRW
jgi:hypothetical protein